MEDAVVPNDNDDNYESLASDIDPPQKQILETKVVDRMGVENGKSKIEGVESETKGVDPDNKGVK